jgi:NAD(P)H dehydrogenase (quinone)
MSIRILVTYYSATGSVHRPAEAVQQGAESAGAEVRLRRVAELAPPEAIASNPAWTQHRHDTNDRIAEVSLDDLDWAGGNPYGTSWPAGFPSTMPDDTVLDCARYQGRRLAHFAQALAAARAETTATSA